MAIARMGEGPVRLGGIVGLPSLVSVEGFARAGYDFVVLDLQHGTFGYDFVQNAVARQRPIGRAPASTR